MEVELTNTQKHVDVQWVYLNPLTEDADLNYIYIYMFQSYLTENTTHVLSVNSANHILENYCCLFWKPTEINKYLLWAK